MKQLCAATIRCSIGKHSTGTEQCLSQDVSVLRSSHSVTLTGDRKLDSWSMVVLQHFLHPSTGLYDNDYVSEFFVSK